MSFRDAHLFRMYRQRPNNLFPLSRLMTHGITQGRYNMLGGENEPLREWSDNVMMYFGRGVQMKELYLSPERMREDMWKPVGLHLRWAQARQALLARTVMVGGDVRKGEPYGYTHWRGDEGVWLLRNPGLDEATIEVPIDQTSGYRGAAKMLYAAVTYPYVDALARPIATGRKYEVSLPPRSVVVVEVGMKPWGKAVAEPQFDVRAKQDVAMNDNALRANLMIDVKAGQTRDARLYFVMRGGAAGQYKISGAGLGTQRVANGNGWQMVAVDIADLPSHLEATVELPKGNARAFSRPGHVEAWIMCDVAAAKAKLDVAVKDEPWAVADGWRRRSAKVLDYSLQSQNAVAGVTNEQIAGATEAALHIEVFGVEGGQYADKSILLNGTRIAQIPINNGGMIDEWEEKVVPLSAEQIKLLRRENAVVLTNDPGDCYKVRNVALAVKLADGRWVESEWDQDVWSSVDGWAWSEGKAFGGAKSPEIRVKFK
jgi:hypothetical protein